MTPELDKRKSMDSAIDRGYSAYQMIEKRKDTIHLNRNSMANNSAESAKSQKSDPFAKVLTLQVKQMDFE